MSALSSCDCLASFFALPASACAAHMLSISQTILVLDAGNCGHKALWEGLLGGAFSRGLV